MYFWVCVMSCCQIFNVFLAGRKQFTLCVCLFMLLCVDKYQLRSTRLRGLLDPTNYVKTNIINQTRLRLTRLNLGCVKTRARGLLDLTNPEYTSLTIPKPRPTRPLCLIWTPTSHSFWEVSIGVSELFCEVLLTKNKFLSPGGPSQLIKSNVSFVLLNPRCTARKWNHFLTSRKQSSECLEMIAYPLLLSTLYCKSYRSYWIQKSNLVNGHMD